MKRTIYLFIAAALVFSGCRKYVEIEQPGMRTLYRTDDYQAIMNNTQVLELTCYYPELASDEVNIKDENFQTGMVTQNANAYIWANNIFGDFSDGDWDNLYHQIYYCNLVTTGIASSQGGTDVQKQGILAQALVHRAYAYFTLVNIYAKQYDPATAASDPGVPVLLQPDFTSSLARKSVKDVYDLVINDLKSALPGLPNTGAYSIYPSQAAVYGVLARVALQQGDYVNAEKYADSALTRQNTLLNLEDYASGQTLFPLKLQNPEIIFEKRMTTPQAAIFPLSDELLNLFDTLDLRYKMYTTPGANFPQRPFTGGRGYYEPFITQEGVYTGICVPEMMLIAAECEARAGNSTAAVDGLNALRKHRFKAAEYKAFTVPANKADMLQMVINERRRELMGRCFRWFDQKRLFKDPAFAKTVTRTFLGQTYTLAPNSPAYVFPIANIYIQQNPEITQNPR